MARSLSDRNWEAEDDLRTLTRAKEIESDNKRLKRAKQAGKRVLKEKKEEVINIQKIAGKTPKSAKNNPGKRPKVKIL